MATFRLHSGPVPLHHQVYVDLRSALDAGDWRPGDRLPPERELASRYGVSVITIRHALGNLTRERRLERSRGRGTFVTRPPVDLDLEGSASFTEELRRRGHEAETRLVAARTQPAKANVAVALAITVGGSTHRLERLRLVDGEPLLLEQVHLAADRFPGLLEYDFERGSLYEVLSTRYGTRVIRAREAIEPVMLRAREARLLAQDPGRPALLVEGTAFDEDGIVVEFGRTFVRGDRTRYYVDRAVRRPVQGQDSALTAPLDRANRRPAADALHGMLVSSPRR